MGSGFGSDIKKDVSRWDKPENWWQIPFYPLTIQGRALKAGFGALQDAMSPDIPSLELPQDEDGGANTLVDEDAARELAMKRHSLERARRGRASLRIDMPLRNPGLSSTAISGLRIP